MNSSATFSAVTTAALDNVFKQLYRNLNQQLFGLDRSGMAVRFAGLGVWKSDEDPNDLMKDLCG